MFSNSTHAEDGISPQPGLLKREFIIENPPFKASHASTIVETKLGLLAAWFGGSRERSPDVGIWLASNTGDGWSAPMEVANGIYADEGRRYPCWNPVLFLPKNGPLLLFYKVGPSPSEWWGMLMTSWDSGKTWSAPTRLPRDIIGPVRNKPVELSDGVLLCGASTEDAGWRVHMETTRSFGKFWTRTPALNSALDVHAIQPTILVHTGGKIQILCRTRQRRIVENWSNDSGSSWSAFKKTSLPNPNSGIDAVMLRDGRSLLVYNHATDERNMLNVSLSENGTDWQAALVLENEPGEFSYPAVIQTADGLVHATYTWKREKIRHVVIDPAKLNLRPITGAEWPK